MPTGEAGPAFRGREQEFARLQVALADRAARPCCLIGGEAGIGKTRLITEFARRAASEGATVVIGGCLELGADVLPFAPFVEALDRLSELAGAVDSDPAGFGPNSFAAPIPDIAASGPDRASGQLGLGRMYEAVRGFLDRGPAPLVLVLEDLHWADRSTLELLDYLVRRLRLGKTLLVATFRNDELHRRHPLAPVLAEFARSRRTTRLDLPPLSDTDIGALVREIHGADAPQSLVSGIVERSEGNPFLAEELLALGAGRGAPLPATLVEVLLARIERLSDPAGEIARIAAVAGRPVDAELIERAWEGAARGFEPALRECVDRSILVLHAADQRVGFRHALLAEAIEGDLLPGTRARLHGRLARVLTERPDLASPTAAGAAAELALHWFGAHELSAAFGASARAAEAAVAARAYPEALRAYERALELWDRVPDARQRAGADFVGLLDRAAGVAILAGDRARAVGLQRSAADLVDPVADPLRAGYLLARLAGAHEFAGEIAEMILPAEAAVAILRLDPPTTERAEAVWMLSSALWWQGRYTEAGVAAQEAVEIAVAVGASDLEAFAHSNLAWTHAGLGRDDEAIAEADRAVWAADRSGASDALFFTHAERVAMVIRWLWRPVEAERALEAERTVAVREGVRGWHEVPNASYTTRILGHLGRWDEAIEVATDALAAEAGHPRFRGILSLARGTLRVRRGQLEAGEADLRAARGGPDDAQMRLEVGCGLAEAALARGEPETALSILREAAAESERTEEIVGRSFLAALRLRAAADHLERRRALRDVGDQVSVLAEAASDVRLLEDALQGRLIAGAGVNNPLRAVTAWGFAEADRLAGTLAPDLWATAATALAAVHQPYLAAYAHYREAEARFADRTDRARAARALLDAYDEARALGAQPLIAEIEALARRSRTELAAPGLPSREPDLAATSADPYGLSPREREVLALLVEGRTNGEIAKELFVSPKTASVHVTHILDKLGVKSRGAAAAVAVRAGLLAATEPLGVEPPRPT
jgi:DNA-binding CsgD family transcriptional regulator/tetratricopeptide (TPR) repeat protein